MAEELDKVTDAALGAVKDALKGFVERHEVEEFAKEKAKLYAQEYVAAQAADNDRERQEHLDNLLHIRAQVRAEFTRLNIEIAIEAKDAVIRIIEAVGGVLLNLGKVAAGGTGA